MHYRDLIVWQKGMDLVVAVYGLAGHLPVQERYGLATQLRRSAVAVPANIAEGHGRLHRGDYVHHLSIANGSVRELETHLEIAVRVNYLAAADVHPVMQLCAEVGRMLCSLMARLRRSLPSPLSPLPSC